MKKYSYKIVCRNCGTVDGMAENNLDLSHLQCYNCKKIGTTIYVKKRSKTMVKRKWKQDDRVIVNFEEELYSGSISELTKTEAKILFDDGDVYDIELKDLKPEVEEDSSASTCQVQGGFHQYDVKWDARVVNFKFKVDKAEFFGWWRKVQVKNSFEIAYGIDLMVNYQGQRYNVETLPYRGKDPRDNLQSLNADICAATSKWLYSKCQGTFDTIDDLQQKAAKPTIMIYHLETLDRIILKLKEYRDTAIRSGGLRTVMFTGDDPEKNPSMRIQMDLTTQAHALKGRVPSLTDGVIFDRVAEDNSKKIKGRGKPIEVAPDSKNVQDLVKKLQASKDKTERRKLRAVLRKMGHKGGSRSSK